MKGARCPWHSKGRDQRDPNGGSQIHKLQDAPLYDSIHLTSHGIQAIRPESEKFTTVDSSRTPEPEYTRYGNRPLGEKDVNRAVYGPDGNGREHTRDSSTKAYAEDINAEAEEFIEEEHQKLKLRKWMSTTSISHRNQD